VREGARPWTGLEAESINHKEQSMSYSQLCFLVACHLIVFITIKIKNEKNSQPTMQPLYCGVCITLNFDQVQRNRLSKLKMKEFI
jgi:hypothetical protein